MPEKYNPSQHQAHDNEREYIAGFNQPTAAEQAKARENMTDEQKTMSKKREEEYERQGEKESFQLMADTRSIEAYRGADHGHSEEEFGNKGYRREERLWISDDGKIYFRQELDSMNTTVFDSKFHEGLAGDTKRFNSEEIAPEEALKLIVLSKDLAESNIKYLQEEIEEFKSLKNRLTVAQKRINDLPKSG